MAVLYGVSADYGQSPVNSVTIRADLEKSEMIARGLKQIEHESRKLARLCSDLVRYPTENPPASATRITGFIKEWLEEAGVRARIYRKERGKENLVSNLSRPGADGLVLYGHSDVVPAGDRKRWTFPPYSGRVAQGRIHGRGASDMKGGLAAILVAYRTVAQFDFELKKNLLLTVIPDEENFNPSTKMLYKLIDEKIIVGQGCIMAEPTGSNAIGVGDKGDLWIRVTTTGKPAHGSSPVLGDSAILKLDKVLQSIADIWNEDPPVPDDVRAVLPFSEELVQQFTRFLGIPEKAQDAKRLLTHTSVNVGTIRGGTMINIVPDEAQAEIALCLAPGVPARNAMEQVKTLVGQAADVRIETILESDPNFTSPGLPFVDVLRSASRSLMNMEPKPFLSTGTSDAHAFRLRGIPTVWFGPGDITGVHGYDEYVNAKDLTDFAKTYFKTAVEYCV